MSPRRIIFIAVALLVSGLTMWLGRSYLEAQRQAALDAQRQAPAAQQPSTMILVAKGNLPAGQFVRPENLRWQPWPNDGIAPSYIVQGQRQLLSVTARSPPMTLNGPRLVTALAWVSVTVPVEVPVRVVAVMMPVV